MTEDLLIRRAVSQEREDEIHMGLVTMQSLDRRITQLFETLFRNPRKEVHHERSEEQ